MISLVLGALFAARVAYLGGELTDALLEFRTAGDFAQGERADFGGTGELRGNPGEAHGSQPPWLFGWTLLNQPGAS